MFNFLINIFRTEEEAKEFWLEGVFCIADIALGLKDKGLEEESTKFSLMFNDKVFADIVSHFGYDFLSIGKRLGIPLMYVDRSQKIEGKNYNPKRDKFKLTKTADETRIEAARILGQMKADINTLVVINQIMNNSMQQK